MQFDEWAKAIQGNANASSGQSALWNNYSASMYDDRKGQEAVGIAQINDINEEAQKDYERKVAAAAQAEAEAKAKARLSELDPSNFKMEPSDDGGYNFYDGAGKPISVYDYAKVVGARPEEILKDSQNPNDQKFVRDHEIVQTVVNAMANQDSKTIGVLRSQYMYTDDQGNTVDPIGSMLEKYRNKSPADLIKDFRNHWGQMYGGTNTTNAQGKTDRMLGDPRRDVKQISDEEIAAIGSSSYDQVTAPRRDMKAPDWWEGVARNAVNVLPFAAGVAGLPGIAYQGAAATGNDPLSKYRDVLNGRNAAWREEEKRRASNPYLSSLYGGK